MKQKSSMYLTWILTPASIICMLLLDYNHPYDPQRYEFLNSIVGWTIVLSTLITMMILEFCEGIDWVHALMGILLYEVSFYFSSLLQIPFYGHLLIHLGAIAICVYLIYRLNRLEELKNTTP